MDGYLGSIRHARRPVGRRACWSSWWRSRANRLLRPGRPGGQPGKCVTYESGIDPVGGDWAQAQIRYYVYAYLYVLFAVEAVFLFPWAVVFDRPGFGWSPSSRWASSSPSWRSASSTPGARKS